MFHPIGSRPPSVYWRRRLVVIASVVLLIVLLVLTVNAIRSDGNGRAQAGSPTSSAGSTRPSSTVATRTTTSPVPSSTSHTSSPRNSSGHPGSASSSTSTPPADCAAGNLALKAVTQHTSYKVGDTPFLQLQVTNTGPKPCAQNLADKQVELRVYNGESRVWGSHDCKVEPGTAVRTLTPKVSVLVSIKWSGLTSRPGCGGTRQRVGAGTYTLYGSLGGRQAGATQFTIS